MEAKPTELQRHTRDVNSVLQGISEAPDPAPLIDFHDGLIAVANSCPSGLGREVTTEFGIREMALRLPIPDTLNPRFWIAIRERWQYKSRHRLSFIECGLRIYIGDKNEEAIQFVRLEWAAPTYDHNGIQSYPGRHAGHPHWHVDRSALVGQEDYLRSLDILTRPTPQTEPEEFSGAVSSTPPRPLFDFSWLQNMHFPARAQWMQSEWDGQQVPGPHQCEPNSLDELTHWWAGALRYFIGELPRTGESSSP
jgi:hypothetical protein